MCVKNGCLDCEGFYSVREIAGCAHCLHSADNHTNEGIKAQIVCPMNQEYVATCILKMDKTFGVQSIEKRAN